MRNIRKLLYILPFIFLLFACGKKTEEYKTNKTNKTLDKTVSTTKKTTTKQTTTEKKYEVKVSLDKEDAATITGVGKFSLNGSTTINISVNEGYTFTGLYNGETLLTNELTYEITNITNDINLTAKFDAETFNLISSVYDDTYGSIEVEDGAYECGSKVTLKANPITGYKLEGWYIGETKISDKEEVTIKMPAADVEIIAKFTIKILTVTINDNVNGNGDYCINNETYSEPVTFEYGEYLEIYFNNITGYYVDKVYLNGDEIYWFEDYITEDLVIDVVYKINEYTFSFYYDTAKVTSNPISLLVSPVEVVEYDKENGYFEAKYEYNTEVSFTIKVKQDYTLDDLIESTYGYICEVTKDSSNVYTITFTITDDYYFTLEYTGRSCEIKGLCDTVEGNVEIYYEDEDTTALNEMTCEYGSSIRFKAIPNKGYRFVKYTTEAGGDLQVSITEQHPEILWHIVNGDVTVRAVFATESFELDCYMLSPDHTTPVKVSSGGAYYLSEMNYQKVDVDGYTFVGWLEDENATEVYSTEDSITFIMPNEDKNIYAYYTQNKYTITFDYDGGTGSLTTQEVTYGNKFINEIPTKEGLTFYGYGYYTDKITHTVETEYVPPIRDYMEKNMKLGNSSDLLEDGYVELNGVIVDSSAFVQQGDTLVIYPYLKAFYQENDLYKTAGDVTLKAIWKCMVVFLEYDGTYRSSPSYIDPGEKIFFYGTPLKEYVGHTFKYWEYNGEKLQFDGYYTQPFYENATIIPYYETNSYKISITKDSGIIRVDRENTFIEGDYIKAYYGAIVTLTAVPDSSDNYYFDFWLNRDTNEKFYTESITFIMSDSDVSYRVDSKCYIAIISVNDSEYGSVDSSGYMHLSLDTATTLTATPNEGYDFIGWYEGEDELSTNKTFDLFADPEIEAVRYIKAVFGKITNEKYERLGNKVWFGYYPQSCLNVGLQAGSNADLIDKLEEKAGPLPTLDKPANYEETKTETDWINYDYSIYPGNPWDEVYYENYQPKQRLLKAPHMWYIDIDYDEDGRYDYRGVLIYSYRTDDSSSTSSSTSTSNTHQDDNHFGRNISYMTYWFKYELIEWDIIENNEGTYKLVANLAIDSQNFSVGANNYANSDIRDFLIDDFYNTAFNTLEKSIMKTMTIGSNNDYVTLLTSEEAQSIYTTDAARITKATEYAQSQNAYTIQNYGNSFENSYWMTRSSATTNNIYYVSTNGSMQTGKTTMTYYGIRPVISVKL